jgi:hypothetical protein
MNARTWRRRALFGALAMVIVLSAVSGIGRNTAGEPVGPPRQRASQVAKAPARPTSPIELEPLQPREAPSDSDQVGSNTFAAKSWHVPPPPPPPKPVAKASPPPPPSAPPMPFSYMGRYEEGGARIILLVKDDRIYTVSEGEVIDNTYRVERLAGGQLELTYLPLAIKQTISAGGT